MTITRDDVRREHDAAMASLDGAQLKALKRINQAFLKARFANAGAKDMMEAVFEEEAASRSGQGAG